MIDASWAISQPSTSSREEGEEHREENDNYRHFRVEIHLIVSHLKIQRSASISLKKVAPMVSTVAGR